MAEDPIRQYSEATRELDGSIAKVRELSSYIAGVGSLLAENPYRLMVSNVKDVKVGFPPEVAMVSGIPSLDGNRWPTAGQIAEVLSDLHQKRKAARNAWHSLSKADREIVSKHEAID